MGLFDGTPLERPVICEQCGHPAADCACPPPAEVRTPPAEQSVSLSVEKRKRGKAVTVIRGLTDEGEHLNELLTTLKNTCGAGGTVKDAQIEIQGRQLDSVRKVLLERGYEVRNP